MEVLQNPLAHEARRQPHAEMIAPSLFSLHCTALSSPREAAQCPKTRNCIFQLPVQATHAEARSRAPRPDESKAQTPRDKTAPNVPFYGEAVPLARKDYSAEAWLHRVGCKQPNVLYRKRRALREPVRAERAAKERIVTTSPGCGLCDGVQTMDPVPQGEKTLPSRHESSKPVSPKHTSSTNEGSPI
ncbi:hypothetical protein B0H11DRAFT_14244 [Mycena galericulata]|nr:hypothetical protein B0H11DRAFT_14244 [Mycena galericulata]